MTAVATRPRRRREPFFDHVRYVRRLAWCRVVQLRWWVPRHGSIHLGLYADFELAVAVGRKVAVAAARTRRWVCGRRPARC